MWNTSMHSNMNFPAPLAVLGFLTAGGGLLLVVLGIAVAYFVRKPRFAMLLMKLSGTAGVIYLGLLLGFSLASHETTLTPGEEKYFCEIDCHLAYTVVDTKTIADGNAVHYTVTMRTRFDETTISSHRPKDAPLSPSPRTATLTDDNGDRYAPIGSSGTPLLASLIPGQSYTTELEFNLPAQVKGLRLLISTTPGWPDHLVIGDENSWLHKKTYFELERPSVSQNRSATSGN
jgi:hypothetical protein